MITPDDKILKFVIQIKEISLNRINVNVISQAISSMHIYVCVCVCTLMYVYWIYNDIPSFNAVQQQQQQQASKSTSWDVWKEENRKYLINTFCLSNPLMANHIILVMLSSMTVCVSHIHIVTPTFEAFTTLPLFPRPLNPFLLQPQTIQL